MIESGELILSDPNDLDSEPVDGRKWIKIMSWVTFGVGTFIGVYSFMYVVLVFKDQSPDEI